jgi:dethiobiotin synthetase
MTVEALRARGADIAGIAFVGDAHEENEAIIPQLSGVPRLGRLPRLAQITPETLAEAFDAGFAGWAL